MRLSEEMGEVDLARESMYLEQIRSLVLSVVEGMPCEVFLFGSRARGQVRRASDFDIGIRGLPDEVFRVVKRRIEDVVEEGFIPHEVDIVNFDRAPEPFHSVALKARVIWKNA